MPVFPTLNTGAVTQYPLLTNSGQVTQVIRFLDGSDQRFRMQSRALRQWQIRLDLLTEGETEQLEDFFAEQFGSYSTFSFPDPCSGMAVPNCRFGSAGLTTEYTGPGRASTSMWVIETNA